MIAFLNVIIFEIIDVIAHFCFCLSIWSCRYSLPVLISNYYEWDKREWTVTSLWGRITRNIDMSSRLVSRIQR